MADEAVTPFDVSADPVRAFTAALPDFAGEVFRLDQRTIPALRKLADDGVEMAALAGRVMCGLKRTDRRAYVGGLLRRRVLREAGMLTEEEL